MDSIIIFCAKYLFILIPLLFLLAVYQANRKDQKRLIIAVVIAVAIAAILDKIGGKLYYDPRPFVSHNLKPLITHAADNGFPSEHTLFTMTISGVIYLNRKRLGMLALAVSLAVGAARIAAHVHSPIDILGAILMGIVSAYLGARLARVYLAKSS
jgi:undecaprenyl-diphosphatase